MKLLQQAGLREMRLGQRASMNKATSVIALVGEARALLPMGGKCELPPPPSGKKEFHKKSI